MASNAISGVLGMVAGKAKLFGLAAGVAATVYKGLRFVGEAPKRRVADDALATLPGCTEWTTVYHEDVLEPLLALRSVMDLHPGSPVAAAFTAVVTALTDFVADYSTLHTLEDAEVFGLDPGLFQAHADNVVASLAYLFDVAGVRLRRVNLAEELEAGTMMVIGLPIDTQWRHAAMNIHDFVNTTVANAQLTMSSKLLGGSEARLRAMEREVGVSPLDDLRGTAGTIPRPGTQLPQDVWGMSSTEVEAMARQHAYMVRGVPLPPTHKSRRK